MPADPERALERRARAAAANPELLHAIEVGAPVLTALDLLGIDRDLAGVLADRPEVRRAVARRAIALQDQLSHEDKGKRDAALIELERVHGWRKPNAESVQDRFRAVLEEFSEKHPEAYARLYPILQREGETAAQKRKAEAGRAVSKFVPPPPIKPKRDAASEWVPQSCADVLVKYWKEPSGEPYGHPYHLAPVVEIFDRCVREGDVEAAIHVCVQHGKTQLALAFLLFFALAKPGHSHIYSTYSATRADEVRKEIFEPRALAAGLNPQGSGDTIVLRGGTTIRFVSAEGAITGNPCSGVALVDDPFKGHSDANSLAHRTRVHQNYDSVIGTRVHPGASRIVLSARFHPDDLIGYVTRDAPATDDAPAIPGFPYVRIPALCDDPENDPLHRKLGEACWPEKRPREWLARRMKNKAVWAALYQGNPQSAADLKFHGEAPRYTQLPTSGLVNGHGLDLAFTIRTSSDHSCIVSGTRVGSRLFITNMLRVKLDPEAFKSKAIAQYHRVGPARAVFFGSGAEVAWAKRYRSAGMTKLEIIRAQTFGDKLARATLSGLLDSWNAGGVQLPQGADWAEEIEAEVLGFTGKDGEPDDIVDALSGLAHAVGLARANGVTGDGWGLRKTNDRFVAAVRRGRDMADRRPLS